MSLGLGAAGSLGTIVQASQISTLDDKVDEKASSADLTSANSKITALETSSASSSTSSAAVCAAVSRKLSLPCRPSKTMITVTHFDWWSLSSLFLFQVATLSADLTKTVIGDLTGNAAATTATNAEILARLNLIEDKINAVGALTC
jgi:hypothetical protein